MNSELLTPFCRATQEVFKQMLNLEVQAKDTVETEDLFIGHEVNVLVGVIGALNGSVTFSFSDRMALECVKTMSGMDLQTIDIFIRSAAILRLRRNPWRTQIRIFSQQKINHCPFQSGNRRIFYESCFKRECLNQKFDF